VHRDAGEPAAAKRHRHLATGSEHDNPAAASDDELVRGAHHALDVLENTDTHVSDECAVNTEHRHAAVVAVGDGDMTAARHEAESTGEVQLTVATAKRPAGPHEAAVPAPEHAESVGALIRHHDEFIVGSHADGKDESTHANEGVEVQARRQYLHAAAAVLRHKHGAVVGDPDLARLSNLQRPVVLPADDTVPLAVHSAVHVKGLGTTAVVRHQQRGAVRAHRDTVAHRPHARRLDDAADKRSHAADEEARHGAAVHAAQRPRHALTTAQHGHTMQCVAQHRRHAHVRRVVRRRVGHGVRQRHVSALRHGTARSEPA
jgi:hypothetical protein